jgi:hypothetical protein
MSSQGGRPKKDDKRISISISVYESAWNEYLNNNQLNNQHNRKIEQYIIRDNTAMRGIAHIQAKLAELAQLTEEYTVLLNQNLDQQNNVEQRITNRKYQDAILSHIRDYKLHPEYKQYVQDQALVLSKKFNLPFNTTLLDLQNGMNGKKYANQPIVSIEGS